MAQKQNKATSKNQKPIADASARRHDAMAQSSTVNKSSSASQNSRPKPIKQKISDKKISVAASEKSEASDKRMSGNTPSRNSRQNDSRPPPMNLRAKMEALGKTDVVNNGDNRGAEDTTGSLVTNNTEKISNPELVKNPPRRRAAAPARNRIAANDDLPSIGGLIYALQQKPSKRPFMLAAITSAVWLLISGVLNWMYLGREIPEFTSTSEFLSSPQLMAMFGVLIIPVVIFWFLALLAWRTQELQLVSSAMTEVAVRLAEPDRIAEQQVASLGQNVRRQVAAMNDAIGRALGRAGELEALVHNEVAALERSYGKNELRIRGLIQELASEREALNNNSDRVRDALLGLGSQVTHEVNHVANQVAQKIAAASEGIAGTLDERGQKVTKAITNAGNAVDEQIKISGTRVTEQLVSHSTTAAQTVQKAGELMNQHIENSAAKTAELLTTKGNKLAKTLAVMTDRVGRDVPQLLDRLGGEQIRLSQVIDSATKNLTAIETTLTQRTSSVGNALDNHTQHLRKVLTEYMHNIDHSMVERTRAIDAAFSTRVKELSGHLDERMHLLNTTFDQQANVFDETFMRGVEAFRVTTENLTTESIRSIETLTTQAHALRNVSSGLLEQIHGLTDKFENRGDHIVQAIRTLEGSQKNIDALLGNRQHQLSGLIDNISHKTVDLDKMLQSYSKQLETSLTNAQYQAKQLTDQLSTDSRSNSHDTLAELQKLRANTQAQAEKVVMEMQDRFSTVTKEVQQQFNTLSNDIGTSTKDLHDNARQAAKDLELTQTEIKSKIQQLPETTRESAVAMRKALNDQLRALESLKNLSSDYSANSDVSVPGRSRTSDNSQLSAGTEQADVDDQRIFADNAQTFTSGAVVDDVDEIPQHVREAAPRLSTQSGIASQRDQWSMGDLLARASDEPNNSASHPMEVGETRQGSGGGLSIKVDVIAKAIDQQTASEIWQRYQNGERGIFDRSLYSHEGQAAFDEIQRRYQSDPDFRQTVLRYLGDFERLLSEATKRDPGGSLILNYLVSETGRVYLLLAHASGRLG